jgi:hypothetical protein
VKAAELNDDGRLFEQAEEGRSIHHDIERSLVRRARLMPGVDSQSH